MNEWLVIPIMLALWFVVNYFILPKFGVNT
jgi:hypothetical protein